MTGVATPALDYPPATAARWAAEAAAGDRSGTGLPVPATSAGPPAGGPLPLLLPPNLPYAMDFGTLAIQVLNSVQYGLLLFLVASGLTLIFGIMGIINLAHGSFYMVGAYLAWSLAEHLGSLWLAIPVGIALSVAIGALLEWLLISRLYQRDHLYQVLLTYGLILIFEELRSVVWGDDVHGVAVPAAARGVDPAHRDALLSGVPPVDLGRVRRAGTAACTG